MFIGFVVLILFLETLHLNWLIYYDIISLNSTLTNMGVGRVALQVIAPRGVTISSL